MTCARREWCRAGGGRPDSGAPGAAHPVAVLGAPADEVHLAHIAEQEAVRRQRRALAEQRAPRLPRARGPSRARGGSTGQHGRCRAGAARHRRAALARALQRFSCEKVLLSRCCVSASNPEQDMSPRQTGHGRVDKPARLQQPRDGRALLEQRERGVRAQHRARHRVVVEHEAAHGARGQAQRLQQSHKPPAWVYSRHWRGQLSLDPRTRRGPVSTF